MKRAMIWLCVVAMIGASATRAEAGRLAAGWGHSVAVLPDGTVWTWGANNNAQLGDETSAYHSTPWQVPGLSGIVAVAAGASHCLALTSDGRVFAWGLNNSGQLGDGSTTTRWAPVQIGLTSIVAIAAGSYHSLALRDDGVVFTWGLNTNGQLGDGSTTGHNTPAAVSGLTSVSAIGAGASFSLAVRTDGGVWGWGANGGGQLGDGTTTQRLTPVAMSGISTGVTVSGGTATSYVVLADGTVRATGGNGVGQIGDGTTTTRTTPVAVTGLSDIAEVAAGPSHALARTSEGGVWSWGGNSQGQLGLGDSSSRTTPTVIPGLSFIAALGAGDEHSLALSAADAPGGFEGILFAWGRNNNNQLGDGTAVATSVPLAITGPGFTAKVATPAFSYATNTYGTTLSVVVSCVTGDVTIHYTTDGSDPTAVDPTVSSGSSVPVAQSLTLKARAYKAGMPESNVATAVYTLAVAQPTFSPSGGTFTAPTSVAMTVATTGAVIRFTTDGTTPTAASPLYSSPVTISTSTTLKAAGFRTGWQESSVRSGTYTINYGSLSAPTASPGAGSYAGSVTVTLSAAPGASIRYTTNGAEPTASSTLYAGPLSLTVTTALKAKAYHSDYSPSPTLVQLYTVAAVAPTFSRESGAYGPGDSVVIDSADPATTIRFTLTGVDPTTADATVAAGSGLLVGDFTLKARASKTGCVDSEVVTATYAVTAPYGQGTAAAGGTHSLVLRPDGLLYAFGLNSSGQVGDGTTSNRTVATLVQTLTGVVGVSGGTAHTLAVTVDGRLFAWGANGSGRLGDGTTTNRSRPVQIAALADIVAAAAGGSHSLALTAQGEVYAWGLGSGGQLGQGTTASSNTPVLVPGLPAIVALAAGGNHSLAVDADGRLWAWGSNSTSQLGDGTTTARLSPVLIPGVTGVAEVSAGTSYSTALTVSGQLYAWGLGSNGQLASGTTATKSTPTLVSGLAALRVAAGGTHALATTTGAQLLGWGANGSGQVGDGTTTQRLSPVTTTLTPVAALIAAGGTHSIAITAAGDVWTWGAGGSGQLGDGTTTAARATPQLAFSLPGTWGATPVPILSLAPGVYRDPQSLSVTHPMPGATVRYTVDGSVPDEAAPAFPAGQVAIDGSQTLRLRAWATGLPPSSVVTAPYVLQPFAPAIAPGSGTFAAPQTLTLTTPTAQTVIRYTLDGSDPDAASTEYAGPFAIGTGTVVTARAFRTGWTPSDRTVATLSFNYGQLSAPIATPPSGTYAPDQLITLSAEAGATILYTLDGSEPTTASFVYNDPLALPTGQSTLKARSYRVDWTPSGVMTAVYQLSTDQTPPTITASTSPAPVVGEWHDEDVTITFSCSDDASGIAHCPDAVVVTREGADIAVTREAIDGVGNRASLTVTVSIDRRAPVLIVHAPQQGDVLSPETTHATVKGTAVDFGSGITSLTCNGSAATIVGQKFHCDVAVEAGATVVTLQASDAIGHLATDQVTVSVGEPPAPTALVVSPARLTMLAGETRELRVADERGRPVTGGTWTTTAPLVAEVSQVEGVTLLQAAGAGDATVTLSRDGLTAEAEVTVLAAGTALAEGTVLWALAPPGPGAEPPKRAQVLRMVPAGDPEVEEPALLFVDEGTEWAAGQLLRVNNRPTRLVATTVDGRQVWAREFTGSTVRHVAADNLGGVVLVLHNAYSAPKPLPERIQRLDGVTGQVTWEYLARDDGELSEVAIHPNGTVYVTEEDYHSPNTWLVALDGATGVDTRWPLPRGHVRRWVDGVKDLDVDDWPSATGPIVRDDGAVVVVTSRTFGESWWVTTGGGPPVPDPAHGSWAASDIQLAVLAEGSAAPAIADLVAGSATDTLDGPQYRLLPDGAGGLLVAHRTTAAVRRIDAAGTLGPNVPLLPAGIYAATYETEYVLGETEGYALVKGQGGAGPRADVVSFNPTTLEPGVLAPVVGAPHVQLRFAVSGGGVHVSGPTVGWYGENDTELSLGHWSGWGQAPSLRTGLELHAATTFWREVSNAPVPRPLTTSRLRELAARHGIGQGLSGVQLNRAIGLAFQGFAIRSLAPYTTKYQANTRPLTSPRRAQATSPPVDTVVPDLVSDYVATGGVGKRTYIDSAFYEVKAVKGWLTLSSSRHQITGLIDVAVLSELGQTWYPLAPMPVVTLVTTADTRVGPSVVTQATADGVELRQIVAMEILDGLLTLAPSLSLNASSWLRFLGLAALPTPPGEPSPLDVAWGASPNDDPDPPVLEDDWP